MSVIISGVKTLLGKLVNLPQRLQVEVLNKESFFKELKEIIEEKKKPGYHDLVMTEIASLGPFDITPKLMDRLRNLVWKYEGKNLDVTSWLGELALNKEEDFEHRVEAIRGLKHTDAPEAIDYLLECLKDKDVFVGIALRVIESKLMLCSNPPPLTPLTREQEELIEGFLKEINFKDEFKKRLDFKDPVIDRLNSIAKVDKNFIGLLIRGFKEQGEIKVQINTPDELIRLRRELMNSLVQEHGEQKAKSLLIKIVLDGDYKNHDAQMQAFFTLKENNGLEDLINHIKSKF